MGKRVKQNQIITIYSPLASKRTKFRRAIQSNIDFRWTKPSRAIPSRLTNIQYPVVYHRSHRHLSPANFSVYNMIQFGSHTFKMARLHYLPRCQRSASEMVAVYF